MRRTPTPHAKFAGGCALVLCAVLPAAASALAPAACTDPSGICVDGAEFDAGATLDDAARDKQARRNAKRDAVQLDVALTEGRASIFLDGAWVGLAPLQAQSIKPGKHDLEVRDGRTVLASGVLSISRKAKGDVRVTVVSRPPSEG